MNVYLAEVTPGNFDQIINLKSSIEQEQMIQIFERWVGSNAFFLAVCQVYIFTPKAIYDSETLIGFTCHGYNPETDEKIGFFPTGEIEKAFHEEHVFKLILEE
ncbi:hypothetical protein J4772_13125 [Cohnella sp. LGH]|uniref:hypothetical protein n=1 Tax=Cohnella sp. LGH TaxID=1619153 RepID=UPI001ADAE0C7|nr:hypothetical protein [Cohnella sp. LGH]QTH45261.1 hypothetical protein J4772_13125 [Cohnella sp. LGH]